MKRVFSTILLLAPVCLVVPACDDPAEPGMGDDDDDAAGDDDDAAGDDDDADDDDAAGDDDDGGMDCGAIEPTDGDVGVGSVLADFSLTDQDGNTHTLHANCNGTTVLFQTASW